MGLIKLTINTSTKAVKLNMEFDKNVHTILNVKEEYCNQEDSSKTPSKMRLYKNGKELANDGATLSAAGIKRSQTLTLTFRVIGGALFVALFVPNSKILNSKRKDRKLDTTDSDIKISKKADLVGMYEEKDGVPRAEMPCGHAFVPDTMFGILRGLITKNKHEHKIICPIQNCKTEWDFDLCALVADLNDEEYEFIQGEIAKRSAPETQECPYCNEGCERPNDLKKFRVFCEACEEGDWCFICAGKWIGGGFTVCGNSNCQTASINQVLQSCPEKRASNNVRVPQIRACPKCVEFIEHDDACKHMCCPQCGHRFCFACLKAYNNGWPCGSYTQQCEVAPRQILK